jgi:hypothetical protein
MKNIVVLFFILLFKIVSISQTPRKNSLIVLGYDQGMYQLGIGKMCNQSILYHQKYLMYNYKPDEKSHGLTASYSFGGMAFLGFGSDLTYRYSQIHSVHNEIILKPKILLLMPAIFSFDFGYNLHLTELDKSKFGWNIGIKIPIKEQEIDNSTFNSCECQLF